MECRPLATIAVANQLGEGVVWDDRNSAFMWTDILTCKLYRLDWPSRALSVVDLPERLGSFALTDCDTIIVGAFASGFARFDLVTGALDWLVRPEMRPGVRFNDGRVDRTGRFVAGMMVENPDTAGGTDRGDLLRLESDRTVTTLVSGIHISNALCWSPGGGTMYHADSPQGIINAYDYRGGAAANRQTLVKVVAGVPDGMCVDAGGRLWAAQWGGGCIGIYAADGAMLGTVVVPASQPTCVAFGGPDLSILAVTSAQVDLDAAALAEQPDAGGLFLFETGISGLLENRVTL